MKKCILGRGTMYFALGKCKKKKNKVGKRKKKPRLVAFSPVYIVHLNIPHAHPTSKISPVRSLLKHHIFLKAIPEHSF